MECHKDIHATHVQTAHYNTSAVANASNIGGSFEMGSNIIELEDAWFQMVKDQKSFYQHTKYKDSLRLEAPKKIDIVIGSGVKGKSYLTWEGENLFQLQVSYYPPTDSWINSPGFPSQSLKRPVRDGCLKCHVTFATNRDFSGQGNRYDKGRMVYGVDCERCHRPAEKHVVFHRKNPDVQTSKFMLKLDTLSRQQRLDVCAQCHSGPRDRILQGNSFSYLSGEDLKAYSRNFYTGRPDRELDVHGNQYGLLTSSQCFKQSKVLDCGTCHDPHQNQRANTAYFNQKCIGCHSAGSAALCTIDRVKLNAVTNNCIDCHMPNVPSKLMSVQLTDSTARASVYIRTHLIGIYSKENTIIKF